MAITAPCAVAEAVAQTRESGGRWERQVQGYLKRAELTLAQQGFRRADELPAGALNTDESASFTVTLDAATSYALLAVCDNDCSELNLVLMGSGDTEVATDRATTVPTLKITPREKMPYRVRVTMASCQMNPCWFKLGVYRRRPD